KPNSFWVEDDKAKPDEFELLRPAPDLMILAANLPPRVPGFLAISSIDDDLSVSKAKIEQLPESAFTHDFSGRDLGLDGPRVRIRDEEVIYIRSPGSNDYQPLATNPWSGMKPT